MATAEREREGERDRERESGFVVACPCVISCFGREGISGLKVYFIMGIQWVVDPISSFYCFSNKLDLIEFKIRDSV